MPPKPVKVLLIEDNAGDARLVRLALSESRTADFKVSTAESLAHGLELLGADRFDAVLLDLSLPDCSPERTVERIAAAAAHNPIVVLTGLDDEQFGREVVKLGAQDYLVKGQFESRLLARAISYAIERKRTQDELARSRDAAIEASEMKSSFVANMSHEIRTPINAVIGMTRMLLDTALDSEQRDFAETAWSSARWLLSIIDDVLDFSKLSAGKLEVRVEEFSPAATIASVADLFSGRARRPEVEIVSSAAAGVPGRLVGGASRIRQVLANLTGNAVKFTERGRISLEVRLESETAAEVTLCFTVSDTGPGIAPAAQRRIFDAFYQADASTTRRHGGTGLGLAVAAELVRLMDGRIGVASEPGRGSAFWFTVPLRKTSPPAPAEAETQGKRNDRAPRGFTGRLNDLGARIPETVRAATRILVAEDHPVNQRVILKMLERMGFHAEAANNGREAIEALRRGRYDLVLMDCQMPELDGYEAARAIRLEFGAAPPIIGVTAHALEGDRKKCLDAGMDDYLRKPVLPEELAAAIGKWLRLPVGAPAARGVAVESTEAPPIDPAAISRLKEDDAPGGTFLSGLIEVFIADLDRRLATMREQFRTGDLAGIAHNVHSLKGGCGHFGAKTLMALCAEAEQRARSGDGDLAAQIERIEAEAARVRAALAAIKREAASA
ncbi:MAG: response regulator [Candidatus Binataceae bacterium]